MQAVDNVNVKRTWRAEHWLGSGGASTRGMASGVLRANIGFGLSDRAPQETAALSSHQMATNEIPRDIFGFSVEEA